MQRHCSEPPRILLLKLRQLLGMITHYISADCSKSKRDSHHLSSGIQKQCFSYKIKHSFYIKTYILFSLYQVFLAGNTIPVTFILMNKNLPSHRNHQILSDVLYLLCFGCFFFWCDYNTTAHSFCQYFFDIFSKFFFYNLI